MKILQNIRYFFQRTDSNIQLFAMEGLLLAVVNNIIANNNNLFATRLGASDIQISAIGSFPQLMGMLILIPGGLLADRLSNKKRLLLLSLILVALFYILIIFTPFFPSPYMAFLVLLTLSAAPMTIYNTAWQAFFSDVVPIQNRNKALTLRNIGVFFIGIVVPFVTGTWLASSEGLEGKVMLHRSFFALAAGFLVFQFFILNKVSGGNVEAGKSLRFREVRDVVVGLAKDKRFMIFAGTAFFFYVTWQMDWTMFYIGQLQYLHLNEAWLSYVTIGTALAQFLTMHVWGKINEKMGVRFGVIIATLSLVCYPLVMVLALALPPAIAPGVFLALTTLAGCAIAPVNLNIIQCLLQVVPETNKTLCISVYTVLIAFSNAVMPMAGVAIYTALGADLTALRAFCVIVVGLRLVAALLWTLRYFSMRKEPKNG